MKTDIYIKAKNRREMFWRNFIKVSFLDHIYMISRT